MELTAKHDQLWLRFFAFIETLAIIIFMLLDVLNAPLGARTMLLVISGTSCVIYGLRKIVKFIKAYEYSTDTPFIVGVLLFLGGSALLWRAYLIITMTGVTP